MMRISLLAIVAVLGWSAASGVFAGEEAEGEHEAHHAESEGAETEEGRMSMMQGGGASGMEGMGKMHEMMAKMHGRKHGGASGTTIIINIHPGGEVAMGRMGGMMEDRGRMQMMQGEGSGMGMMHGEGSGMGMMRRGEQDGGMGMMRGEGGGMMAGPMRRGTGEDLDLSADDVRARMEKHLAQMGRDLTLGEIAPIDEDLISVEILTEGGEPHHRMVVNRHSGAMMRAN